MHSVLCRNFIRCFLSLDRFQRDPCFYLCAVSFSWSSHWFSPLRAFLDTAILSYRPVQETGTIIDACKTLQTYYGNGVQVINEDIFKITEPTQFWRDFSGVRNGPDIVYGGPPCQSFSQAGKQKGVLDGRGQLVFEFLRFVESLTPSYFVMENVKNLKGIGGGGLYRQILEQMNAIGYNVTVGLLLAAEFGAPQLRNRLLFLGCRKDIGHLTLPTPQYYMQGNLFEKPFMTVSQAFEGLPMAEFSQARTRKIDEDDILCIID